MIIGSGEIRYSWSFSKYAHNIQISPTPPPPTFSSTSESFSSAPGGETPGVFEAYLLCTHPRLPSAVYTLSAHQRWHNVKGRRGGEREGGRDGRPLYAILAWAAELGGVAERSQNNGGSTTQIQSKYAQTHPTDGQLCSVMGIALKPWARLLLSAFITLTHLSFGYSISAFVIIDYLQN